MLLYLFISHFFLVFSILLLLLLNALIIRSYPAFSRLICVEIYVQTAAVLLGVLFLIINSKTTGFSTDYNFKIDRGQNLVQIVSVAFMLLSLPSVFLSFRSQNLNFFEFFVILLIILLGLLFFINSSSFLSIFISIEIIALCSIILSSFHKVSAFSTESGLKYFISSATFSGIFLLGVSFIYLFTGSVSFDNLFLIGFSNDILELNSTVRFFIEFGLLLILFWLLFKVTGSPFNFWVSDVYDGAPLATTIFLAVVPKFALIIFLLKWQRIFFSLANISNERSIFILCGVFTCLFGFISALKQKKLKKVFIFSSMGQIGFIIAAVNSNNFDSCVGVIMFSLIYLITSVISWGLVSVFFALDRRANLFRQKKVVPFNLTDLNGLYLRNKELAILVAFVIFSFSAIPPMLGFYGKFEIFSTIYNDETYFEMMLIIVLSSMSSYYYMEIVRSAFFEGELKSVKKREEIKFTSVDDVHINVVYNICCFLAIFLLLGFIFPEIIISISTIIAYTNNL